MNLENSIQLHEILAGEDTVYAREFSQKKRKKLAKSGAALPGGGFPIVNREDLSNAKRAIGRAKNPAAARRHINERAKALGAPPIGADATDATDVKAWQDVPRGTVGTGISSVPTKQAPGARMTSQAVPMGSMMPKKKKFGMGMPKMNISTPTVGQGLPGLKLASKKKKSLKSDQIDTPSGARSDMGEAKSLSLL